jgi:hypothetical protein
MLNDSPKVLDTDDNVKIFFVDLEAGKLISFYGYGSVQWLLQDL